MKDVLARDYIARDLDGIVVQHSETIDALSAPAEIYGPGINGTFGPKIAGATETSRLLAIRRWRALA
jgi:hypothetical protein